MERSNWEEGTLISDAEAMEMSPALDELSKSLAWTLYQDLLRAARVNAREVALGQGKEKFDWWQGYVSGLAAAGALPAMIVQQAVAASAASAVKARPKMRRNDPFSGDSGDVGGF